MGTRRRPLRSTMMAALLGVTVFAVCAASAQALPTYSSIVLGDGPAGYWRFGELPGATTMVDSSATPTNGTYLGGVTLGVVPGAIVGDANTAATYDGSNDQGRVPASAALNVGATLSAEAWIKRSSDSKSHELMNKGANGLQLIVLNGPSLNRVWLRRAGVATLAQSTLPVPADGNYHHVVATVSGAGTTARIYIDGVLGSTVSSGAQISNTTFPLTFGSFGSSPATPAQYDDFALYGRVLSAAEVQEHHAAGTAAPDTPPTAANDLKTVNEDSGSNTLDVLTNDSDPDGGPKFVQSVGSAAHGSTGLAPGGTGVTYAPAADYCGPDSFNYALNGGSPATVSVTVTCMNDSTTVDTTDTPLAYNEGDGATTIDGGLTLADPDDTNLTGATVQITAGLQSADELLFTNAFGVSNGGYVEATGLLTLTGTTTLANYQLALRAVQYRHNGDAPSTPKTVSFRADDGDGLGPAGTRNITVTPSNDKPVVTTSPGSASFDAGGAAVAVDPGILVSDPDSANLAGAVVHVAGPLAEDELAFTSQFGITGSYIDATGDLTLSGPATVAQYQTVLRSVTYDNTSAIPGNASRTVSFTVTDSGSAVSDAASRTVTITTAANAAPVVTTTNSSLAYIENDSAKTIDAGVTVTDANVGGSITGATVAITVNFAGAQDVLALSGIHMGISALPQIGNTLSLTGTATPAAYETALRAVTYFNTSEGPSTLTRTVTFTVTDDTVLSGSDTRDVTVAAANDLPNAVDDTGTTNEDTPLTVLAPGVLDNDTDADPVDTKTVVALNGSGTLTGATAEGGSVTIGADGSYTYTPPAAFQALSTGQSDTDSFQYTMSDAANAQSSATVNLTVNGVSDAPTAGADSFDAIGNTGLFVGTTRPATQAGREIITGSVLTNDSDPDSPHANLVVEPVTNAPTTLGGTITIEADGNFTYHPDDGVTADTDSFTYRVCDNSPCNSGTVANATGTLSLPIAGQVWYVRNNEAAGGDGTSDTPFDTLLEAESATGTSDTVYVFDGDNTTMDLDTGFVMKHFERLIGEIRPLTLDPDGGGPLPASSLFPGTSGAQPTLAASNEDVILLAPGVTVDGFTLDPSGTGGGIAGGPGAGGGIAGDVTIAHVDVVDTGTLGTQPGIELNGTTGTNTFTGVTVTNGGSDTAIGVRLNSAGTVQFANTATNTIATTGAKALDAQGTTLSTSRWNDITVTGSGSGAIRLNNTGGSPVLGDGAGTDLSLETTSGTTAALDIAGSSNNVTVDAGGDDNISATGGPAVDIRNSNGSTFSFDSVSSTSSAGSAPDGINLDSNQSTPFTAETGAISGAAGIAVDVNGSGAGADVSYGGQINDGPGPLSAEVTNRTGGAVTLSGDIADDADPGGGILLSSNTGGTTTFSGTAKVLNTGSSTAVSSTASSSSSALSFTNGGLDIAATSGAGLDALSGGTISVEGTTNTIDTGTGRALRLQNSVIADTDVTLRSVSSNGAANGILLDNTANLNGKLVVTGNAGTCTSAASCTGGAIQNSTGAGISLNSVPGGVSLTRVAVTSGDDDGIRATTVADLDLADSIVTNNGNFHAADATGERGLEYLNVTGTPQILRTTVSGSDDTNAHIQNTVAGTTTLNVDASTFSNSWFNAGLRLRGEGPSVMNATIVNSFFTLNADPGFSMSTDSANTAQQTLLFASNQVSGGGSNAVSARPQISINADSGSVVKATVTNNQIKSAAGAEVILNTLESHTGTFDVKFNNNSIGDAQPGALDALADGGSSIWGWAHGDGVTRMEIRNNTVQNWGGRALELSHNTGNGYADYTVTGNVFSNPDTPPNGSSSPFEAMYVFSGAGNDAGDTSDVCVDMENNDFDGIGRNSVGDLGLDRDTDSFLRFADFNGTAVNPPPALNLRDLLRSKNPLSPALTVEDFSAIGVTATTVPSCDLPVGTP